MRFFDLGIRLCKKIYSRVAICAHYWGAKHD